jgi:glycerate 2-kinase
VPHLVAAPDKFRATATARAAADAIRTGAAACGWGCTSLPMSDGGEGFVEAIGTDPQSTSVRGPLSEPVVATWSLRRDGTAVIESAAAVGRALLLVPHDEEPVDASTYGVGELVVAALASGATSIVVGCGGSSTSDGGRGCVEAIEAAGATITVPLVAACDVDSAFLDAARIFGPQKGATPEQVERLTTRLRRDAEHYLDRYGVDVTVVAGAGAAGGLAGGLVALGATVDSGARLVAEVAGLADALAVADAVVTGEGQVDGGTLAGKVVTQVLGATTLPSLVVTGRAEPEAAAALRTRKGVAVVELDDALQRAQGTPAAITAAVTAWLTELRPTQPASRQSR